MDNATRRQILERVKQLGYPNTIEALQNPQILDQYEQQLQAQSQQQQPIQQPEPITFPTPPATTPNYKVPQPRQSEAKPLVMSFNETAPQLMKNGGPKDKGKEYKTPTGQSIYLDPNFKSYARYLDSNGNVIPVTELQKFSMIYDPQANTWDSTHSEKTLNVYDRRMSFEDRLNKSLGDPMGKAAREAAEGLEPGEDQVDNFRHPLAGMYTQQAIAKKTGNIPIVSPVLGWVGANIMGVGHELGTIFNDNRPLKYKGREALEDIFNNAYGATIGLLPIPNESKEEILYKTSAKNMIPDGISHPDGRDFYFKKMGGKKCYTCNSSKMKVLYNKANYKK